MFPARERAMPSGITGALPSGITGAINGALAAPTTRTLATSRGSLLLIDDTKCEPFVGGNKARKLLSGLLHDAQSRGARRLLTCGATGSHHVLAASALGPIWNLDVHALLWPQAPSVHADCIHRASLRFGLREYYVQDARDFGAAFRALAAGLRGDTAVIPLGGSTPASLEAHAHAVRQLLRANPAVAKLDAIVVPLGSGGTSLGVALGLSQVLGNEGPRVHGILVSRPAYALRMLVSQLVARATLGGLIDVRLARSAMARLCINADYIDPGYGAASERVLAAITWGNLQGIHLDPTYTGKAFAAALDFADRRATPRSTPVNAVGFWHTLGRVPGSETG